MPGVPGQPSLHVLRDAFTFSNSRCNQKVPDCGKTYTQTTWLCQQVNYKRRKEHDFTCRRINNVTSELWVLV